MSLDQEGKALLEDRLAGDLLDRLNETVLPAEGSVPTDDATEDGSRAYLEVVGLLPYELEPMVPSAATRERILSGLDGKVEPSHGAGYEEPPPLPKSGSGDWRSWALPLAAGLALALVGVSGWQRLHIERQQEEIVRLDGRLEEVTVESEELARYRQGLQEAQAKLAVLSASGVEVCSLFPVEDRLAASPTATLFVAPDHQHWYLRIDDLEPSPEGHAYQLWFITDRGAQVSAGTFDPRPGARTELTSETMPGGTVAVSVTLEPVGGSAEPSGEPLLYGDEVMRIL